MASRVNDDGNCFFRATAQWKTRWLLCSLTTVDNIVYMYATLGLCTIRLYGKFSIHGRLHEGNFYEISQIVASEAGIIVTAQCLKRHYLHMHHTD